MNKASTLKPSVTMTCDSVLVPLSTAPQRVLSTQFHSKGLRQNVVWFSGTFQKVPHAGITSPRLIFSRNHLPDKWWETQVSWSESEHSLTTQPCRPVNYRQNKQLKEGIDLKLKSFSFYLEKLNILFMFQKYNSNPSMDRKWTKTKHSSFVC